MPGNKHGFVALLLAAACSVCVAVADTAVCPSRAGDVRQALSAYQAGDYPAAESLAVQIASRADQPNPRAWIIVGDARRQLRQWASAVRAYRLFLASCDCGETRTYVSRQMRLCQAGLNGPAETVAPSKRLSAGDKNELAQVSGETFIESSEHFVIYARNSRLARLLTVEAEDDLVRICRVILNAEEYCHRVEIHVWVDHDDYHLHCPQAMEFAGGSFTFTPRDGVMIRRIDIVQDDDRGGFADEMLDRVLPHEMCHLVLKELFGDSTCPLSLNEGLAMLAEAEVDNGRVVLAGTALAGKGKIDLQELLASQDGHGKDMSVFYAESFSFVDFLHRRMSPEQLSAFLEHLKGGCTVADALARTYYVPSTDDFQTRLAHAWEDYAITQCQIVQTLRQSLAANGS